MVAPLLYKSSEVPSVLQFRQGHKLMGSRVAWTEGPVPTILGKQGGPCPPQHPSLTAFYPLPQREMVTSTIMEIKTHLTLRVRSYKRATLPKFLHCIYIMSTKGKFIMKNTVSTKKVASRKNYQWAFGTKFGICHSMNELKPPAVRKLSAFMTPALSRYDSSKVYEFFSLFYGPTPMDPSHL